MRLSMHMELQQKKLAIFVIHGTTRVTRGGWSGSGPTHCFCRSGRACLPVSLDFSRVVLCSETCRSLSFANQMSLRANRLEM